MKLLRISMIVVVLITLLIPSGSAFAQDIPDGDGGDGGDLGPFPDPNPSNPVVNKITSAGDPPWCVSKLCFNPSYFYGGGEITLEQDGNTVKIATTGNIVTNGQLSLPLPQGADPTKCTFYKDGAPQPNKAFPGNDGNVFAYIWQPPGSISGTWSVQCIN